jgi:nitroreductase
MDALVALCTRHSVGPKQLIEPGPTDAQLQAMVQAALHASDHAERVPFRFAVVQGEARQRLAALFEQAALRAGKTPEGARIDAERAQRPPMTVALLARLDLGHPLVPVHEQWVAVGAAMAHFLAAAHAQGLGGKMLSGAKVRDAAIQAAFCEPGETLVGWMALGTPRPPDTSRPAKPPRAAKATPDAVCREWA